MTLGKSIPKTHATHLTPCDLTVSAMKYKAELIVPELPMWGLAQLLRHDAALSHSIFRPQLVSIHGATTYKLRPKRGWMALCCIMLYGRDLTLAT